MLVQPEPQLNLVLILIGTFIGGIGSVDDGDGSVYSVGYNNVMMIVCHLLLRLVAV